MIEVTKKRINSIFERRDHSNEKYCPMTNEQKKMHVGKNSCAWFLSISMITKTVTRHLTRKKTSSLLRTFW